VGSSNIEDFVNLMEQYDGSHGDFDLFIVPVVKESKQTKDSIATINTLSSIGIPQEKIRIIFNRVDTDDVIEEEFFPLFSYHEDNKNFTIGPKAAIHFSELYQNLSSYKTSIDELLSDTTDCKAKLRETTDSDEKINIVSRISMRRLATSAQKNLDAVYAEIMRP